MWRTRLALRNLSTARLRTGLTILGVIIGVALIVTTMVVGSSAVAWTNSQAFGNGLNVILLSTGYIGSGGYNIYPTPVFGNNTVSALKSIDGVSAVYPAGAVSSFVVVRGVTHSIVTQLLEFVDPSLLSYIGVRFVSGSPQSGGLLLSNTTAHLLNVSVGSKLTLQIQNDSAPVVWTVGGIFVPPSSILGEIFTHGAYLPLSAWKGPYPEVYVVANGVSSIGSVQSQTLSVARRTASVETVGFNIQAFSLQTLASGAVRTAGTFLNFFLFAGVLSLVIGGIGVTNVMLMSLKERIREIGVLKSIGASDSSIFVMFAIEAAFVGFFGGIIGLGLGLAASIGVLDRLLGIPFSPSVLSIVVGPRVGAVIGVGFGVYPAFKAYKISPGEALRWEW